jgi:hypothetical protein
MSRVGFALPLALVAHALVLCVLPAPACCPAPPAGRPVVNADQTVIILWDAAARTQHFIRKASFQCEADDFGFLVPSPAQPELSESGNDAFPYLQKLTEPEKKKVPYPSGNVGCGCSGVKAPAGLANQESVRVLDEKLVAGFKATVLEASSAKALVRWLVDNGYAFSAEVEAWAKPYVEAGWKITALKVAKAEDEKRAKGVTASALRMSFKTDRPLFPYREPDPTTPAKTLGAKHRLLRIYFLAEARYEGELTKEVPWTGKVAWANKLSAEDRRQVLDLLKLPRTTGPAEWWLTEFEDDWPYRAAPGDVYFRRAAEQKSVKRPPIVEYTASAWPTDVMACALAVALVAPPLLRRARRRGGR